MAIGTYAELQTAVANWLHRSGMTAIIPDLISMGEATINRKLRLLQMEESATITTSTTDRFATLPTGFMEAIDLALYYSNSPSTLTQLPLSKINGFNLTNTGFPRYYSISSNIIFDTISDQAYTGSIRYYKRLDIATDLTNWVLTKHPDIYLYASLMAAAPYIKNDERLNTWVQLLQDAYKSANRQDARSRSKAMLVIDSGLSSSNVGNIITGDDW